MKELPPFRARDWFAILLVLAVALATRIGYVLEATANGNGTPAWQVQGAAPARAPFTADDEPSAYFDPGYPWLVSVISSIDWPAQVVLRWLQIALGALTALLFFLFSRRAFGSLSVALLTGLLTALHPWWIVNVAETADGVLATFLVAATLFLGTRASQAGGAFTSLLFGVTLAALSLVRAAYLPFALLSLLWFLLQCRSLRQGWLCALLAFLGLANGLAPLLVHNLQTFGRPLPIVSSTWLHLYMGNNPKATGGYLDEVEIRASLPPRRLAALLSKTNQASRYDSLASDTLDEIVQAPGDACNRRIMACTVLLLGEPYLKDGALGQKLSPAVDPEVVLPSPWLDEAIPGLLAASLALMIVLGLWGWRRSLAWGATSTLATFAAVFLPLPYLLGHAGPLLGPRLPWDGIWLTYAALGLSGLLGLDTGKSGHSPAEND